MGYLAPYWLLDPLTMIFREMQVVVVYQHALLRRSSMGTAGATTTCSSILASRLCLAKMQKQYYQLLTFLNWLLTIYITKALCFYQTQSRYDSNNEVPVDVKFVDFQSSFRFRWYQPFIAFFYDNNHFLIMFVYLDLTLGRYLGTISSAFSQLRWVCKYIQGVF